MKRILTITGIGLLLIGIFIQLIPYGHDHTNPPISAEPDWNRPDEQHAEEFQKVFEENSMPPAQYLLLHPEARLSTEERQKLIGSLMKLAEQYEEEHGHQT